MRYQLVLQFRGDSMADYDGMIALEDRLLKDLGQCAKVDGHDCGSGETNIFIFTNDPTATFSMIRQRLNQEGRLHGVIAAYRDVEGEDYTVLWPEGSAQKFTLA